MHIKHILVIGMDVGRMELRIKRKILLIIIYESLCMSVCVCVGWQKRIRPRNVIIVIATSTKLSMHKWLCGNHKREILNCKFQKTFSRHKLRILAELCAVWLVVMATAAAAVAILSRQI